MFPCLLTVDSAIKQKCRGLTRVRTSCATRFQWIGEQAVFSVRNQLLSLAKWKPKERSVTRSTFVRATRSHGDYGKPSSYQNSYLPWWGFETPLSLLPSSNLRRRITLVRPMKMADATHWHVAFEDKLWSASVGCFQLATTIVFQLSEWGELINGCLCLFWAVGKIALLEESSAQGHASLQHNPLTLSIKANWNTQSKARTK